MKFQHLPLIALLLFGSFAQAAQKDNSPEKKAVAASITTTTIAKQEHSVRAQGFSLSNILPRELLELIQQYQCLNSELSPALYQTSELSLTKIIASMPGFSDGIIAQIPFDDVSKIIMDHNNVAKAAHQLMLHTTTRDAKAFNDGIDQLNPLTHMRRIELVNDRNHTTINFPPLRCEDNPGVTARFRLKLIGLYENIIAIAPDGNFFVTTSRESKDNDAKIWDKSDAHIATLVGHEDLIKKVGISQDGSIIVVGSDAGSIKVWNSINSQCITTFSNHRRSIKAIAITPNGNTVITASNDNVIHVWHKSGKSIMTKHFGSPLECNKNGRTSIEGVAITPDGTTVITAFNNGDIIKQKLNKEAQQIIHQMPFEQLLELRQLLCEFHRAQIMHAPLLTKPRADFLFRLPALLQRNICDHFEITETQEEFEKRTDQDRKSCK